MKKLYFKIIKMIKKYERGLTLIEVIVASVVLISITGAIYYGILSVNYSIRNAELNQAAFSTLSNKMEELKAQVALNRIQSPSSLNKRICIEYNSIRDMINAGNNVGNGCKTVGYFSHNIRSRQTESVHTNIFDIQASIKWKMITRLGQLGRDTTLKLNVSQLVFN